MIFVFLSPLVPIICILCRFGVSAIVSVPKASINKNRYALIKKNKIRMTFNIVVTSPSGNVPLEKKYWICAARLHDRP